MSFQGFLYAVNCVGPRTLSVTFWIGRLPKSIPSQKVFEWVGFLWLIHLDRLINYSYSFEKQPATRIFKNKNCCFPKQGNVSHHTKKNLTMTHKKLYLKRTWPIHQFLRSILWRVFAAVKASFAFIKNRCRSSRRQMFFNIGVIKNFAMFTQKHLCWSLFLIKMQAFRCFPVNIAKLLRAAF